MFTELPLLDRPRAARAAGFDAVEFWWPFSEAVPRDPDVDAFVSAVRDAGVALTGLNFFASNMAGGERGLVSLPDRSAELHDSIDVTVEIGQRLGCRLFNALYGNRLDGVPPELQDELALANLALAATAAARVGGTVLLEPLSGVARFPLRTAADALAVINRVRRTTVGMRSRCSPICITSPSTATTSARSPPSPTASPTSRSPMLRAASSRAQGSSS